jgi:MFS family permease
MKKINLYNLPRLRKFISTAPEEYNANFFHLTMDMAWFGVLNGSIIAFISIYAARVGASAVQIGLLSASPAIMNLLFALPAGNWIQKRPVRISVFSSAVASRFFYLILVFLPVMFLAKVQIWVIILITLIMNIPGTSLAIGANALFAEAVPVEYRGYVAGLRNAVLSITTALVTFLSGWILTVAAFPLGYQIVFGIGFIGAGLSCLHLFNVRPLKEDRYLSNGHDLEKQPAIGKAISGIRSINWSGLTNWRKLIPSIDILKGPFGITILLLFLFHLGQYLAIPVFPLFQVNGLHLSDQVISLGSGIFNIAMFLGSAQLARYISRFGNHKVFAVGVMLLSTYPLFISFGKNLLLYYLASILGGYAWALAGGALYNYLLEKIPINTRANHLAWYNLGLNAAILIGSLGGPALGGVIGLQESLLIFAACRFLAGVAILRWG